jgi:hypothetical protein
MFAEVVDLMTRRFLRGQNLTLGLSVFLFTFMFLPTFLVLLAVVAFFLLAYPRLRKSSIVQRIDAS